MWTRGELNARPTSDLKNIYEIYLTMQMTCGMSAVIGNEPPPERVITSLATTRSTSRGDACYTTATFSVEKRCWYGDLIAVFAVIGAPLLGMCRGFHLAVFQSANAVESCLALGTTYGIIPSTNIVERLATRRECRPTTRVAHSQGN